MKIDYQFLSANINSCYNQNQKAEFIYFLYQKSIKLESLHSYISPFVSIAKYEDYFKSDILDMSKYKVASVFEMSVKSYAMFSNFCTVFKEYFSYYNKDFSKVRPNFNELDISGNIGYRFVKDYESLVELTEEAFPLNDGSLDEFRRLSILLSFLGFRRNEIRMIKQEDVNFENNSISYMNHYVSNIPNSCMILCSNCMQMKEVCLNNTSHMPYNKRTFFPLCDNNFLIRSRFMKPENNIKPIPTRWFDRTISMFNEAVNTELSFDNIRASGLYAWLYSKEQTGEFNPNQPRRMLEEYYKQYLKINYTGGNLSKNYDIWKQLFYGY